MLRFSEFFRSLGKQLRYFGDHSTLHGVRFIISMSYIPVYKRIFWLIILNTSVACAAAILLPILKLYSRGSVSYFVETDYLEFDTPFPAITLCEQVNGDGVKSYTTSHNIHDSYTAFLKDVSFWTPKFCKACPTCKNTTCIGDFQTAVDHIRMKCLDLLKDCWWGGKYFPCCERFVPMETEYGVCFSFNSRLTGNETSLVVNRQIGLPDLIFTAAKEINIRVHSPDDMVTVGMENVLGRPIILPYITDFEVILKAEHTISDISVSAMTPAARGCLYKNERPVFAPNWPFKMYSYSTCVLFCRANAQMNACNCTHHLMPKMRGFPYCDIQGLACLSLHKDVLGSVSCDCSVGCEEISYKLVHMFMFRHIESVTDELNARGTQGRVRLAILPTSRIRRNAIRYTLGLVVDIGGVGGVFFGASLLNVIEIVYLICIRRQH